MKPSTKNMLIGVAIVVIGVAFLLLALDLAQDSSDPFGPALAPEWIAIATIVLGVSLAVFAFVGRGRESETDTESSGITAGGLLRAVAIIAAGALHMFLFSAVGFMIASIVTLFLLLVLFADWRNPKWLVIAVGGGVFFHLVFIELMSLYDPNAVVRLRDFGLN